MLTFVKTHLMSRYGIEIDNKHSATRQIGFYFLFHHGLVNHEPGLG